jgi:hypothetical protein
MMCDALGRAFALMCVPACDAHYCCSDIELLLPKISDQRNALAETCVHLRLRVEAAFYSAQRPGLPVTVTVTATTDKLPTLRVRCCWH